MILASITPLSDFETWLRTDALEVVMLVTGAVLIGRAVTLASRWLTARIDSRTPGTDSLIRSESAKHRHAVTSVLTGSFLALLYFITGILVVQRLDVPLTSLVAPAAVAAVALGFGAQNVVQDLLAGFLIVSERQQRPFKRIVLNGLAPSGGWCVNNLSSLAEDAVLAASKAPD